MTTDTLDLEMDRPSNPTIPGMGPLGNCLVAVRTARTLDELAAAIVPARTWPEGKDKQVVRAALREREAQLKAQRAPAPVADLSKVANWPASDRDQLHAGLGLWTDLWAAVGRGLAARPHQRRYGAPMATQPPVGDPSQLGRVRQAIPTIPGNTSPVAPSTEPTVVDVDNAYNQRAAVRRQDVVIGARADGSGILTGWMGFGELSLPAIRAALVEAGLPESWAPLARSHHAHASAALTELTSQGRILRAERGRRFNSMGIGAHAGQPRNYVARWTVGNPTHGSVGEHMGEIVLTAALTQAGALDCAGDLKLCDQVRAEFDRRVACEAFPAGSVTDWLRSVLQGRLGGVRLGANWYVPQVHADVAERLCEALAKVWGQAWILPALPISTTDQLRKGLVRGLADEAKVVLSELEAQRTAARRDRPGADIGAKAAATLLAKLKDVYTRSKGYADMLGANMVADLRKELTKAVAELEPLCDDTAQRFSMLDLV